MRIESDIAKAQDQLSLLENDLREIQERIDDRHEEKNADVTVESGRLPNESRREYLIRTGKITPFSKMGTGPREGPLASLHDTLIDAEDERDEAEALQDASRRAAVSHRNLRLPGIDLVDASDIASDGASDADKLLKRKRNKHDHRQRPDYRA